MGEVRTGRTRFSRCLTAAILLLSPVAIHAQQSGSFFAIGGGASFPPGDAGDAMDPGWVAQLMAGRVLPGDFASARIGVMYGQSRVPGAAGAMGTTAPVMIPGTQRMIAVLGGLMAMPRWNYDWFPYVFVDAGAVSARLHGSATSFAWSTGAGTTLQWSSVDFFVEARFLQARRAEGSGEMLFATTGVRVSP
jgi:hypothetical protein